MTVEAQQKYMSSVSQKAFTRVKAFWNVLINLQVHYTTSYNIRLPYGLN